MKNKDIEDIIIEYCEGFEHLEFNYSDLPEMVEKIEGELTKRHHLSTTNKNTMSKIESIIKFECYDDRLSDCEWTLRKGDVPEIAKNIKKLLIEEIKKAPHTFDDAVECINDF